MLAGPPDSLSSSPERSPRDICGDGDGRPPIAEIDPAAAAAAANPRRSGEGQGAGEKGSEDPEPSSNNAFLLDNRGHRRKNSDDVGGESCGETPGSAAMGSGPPLWGQGGLLSPWRVRLLLLLVSVQTV